MSTVQLMSIASNRQIAKNTFEMVLCGQEQAQERPGQFVNIEIDGFYLRRPISVCDTQGKNITIIYKVVGDGTKAMTKLPQGTQLSVLRCLGNGFDSKKAGQTPLLIGGGVGVPPMFALAKQLRQEGITPTVVLGFGSADEVFYKEQFENLGCSVTVCTIDGTIGTKGFVTDALPEQFSHYFTCGPEAMLKAVHHACGDSGQLSFESRMACGFGACMGCSCEVKYGTKRICKDGPILLGEEIVW